MGRWVTGLTCRGTFRGTFSDLERIEWNVAAELTHWYFLQCNGLCFAIGHEYATDLIDGELELDEDGYIDTVPGKAEISVPGVFAWRDVQDTMWRHAITAAGSVFYVLGGQGWEE
jgi:thioredoxin reductase